MKILQLTVHYAPNVGGVETHLSDLVGEIVKRGHNVFVLAYRPLMTKASWKILEKNNSLTIFRIPWFPGMFYKLVKNPLLEFIYLFPGLFFVTPFLILFVNPDIIHAHGIVAGFIGVFWGKAFGKRVVLSTHSIYNFSEKGLYRNFVKSILIRSDKVLTLSRQSKKEIINLGIDAGKVQVFTYWIDLKKFKPTSNEQKAINKKKLRWKDKFIVFFVGRLVEEKGVLVLLEAAREWNKNIKLVIVGTGPLEERIKNQELRIKNLEFLGSVDNNKLPLYYSVADVVIVPSIHEEGFGRVILESLACGTPVIGSNRGAIPEAMDETVGRLIDINPMNVKNAVEYFYKNSGKLQKLSENTRNFAEKRYSEKNVETIIEMYKR